MAKVTNYSELRNTLLVISFNQPTGEMGQQIQPVVIEARTESITTEGAVRNVTNTLNIGTPVEVKLTNEEIFKTVYSLNPVLAKALEGVLLEAVAEDVSKVDTSKIVPVKVTDIAVEAVK